MRSENELGYGSYIAIAASYIFASYTQIIQELLEEPSQEATSDSEEIKQTNVKIQVNITPIQRDAQTQVATRHIGKHAWANHIIATACYLHMI